LADGDAVSRRSNSTLQRHGRGESEAQMTWPRYALTRWASKPPSNDFISR
jgi:hypothetical protein